MMALAIFNLVFLFVGLVAVFRQKAIEQDEFNIGFTFGVAGAINLLVIWMTS